MKRRSRLEAVQRVRKIREDQARAEAARARLERERAAAEVDQRQTELEEVARLPLAARSLPPLLLTALYLQGLASNDLLELATDEHERTVDRQRQATKRVKDAAIKRRSIERLANRREAEAIAASRAAAERAMDELMVLMQGRES